MKLIAILILFATPTEPTVYTRDQLLSLRNKAAILCPGDCLWITRFGLRRRGCRAGFHKCRRVQAARGVTSSVIPGETPSSINNNQLIAGWPLSQHVGRSQSTTVTAPTQFTVPVLLPQYTSTLQPSESSPLSTRQQEIAHTGLQLTDGTLKTPLPAVDVHYMSPSVTPRPVRQSLGDATTLADDEILLLSFNSVQQTLSPALERSIRSDPGLSSGSESLLSDYCINNLYESSRVAVDDNVITDTVDQVGAIGVSGTPGLIANQFYKPRQLCLRVPRMPVLLNTNIRGGFCAKADELSCLLSQLSVDIAFLTETWLHAGIPEELTQIPHFTTYRNDRSDGRQGGGLAFIVRDDLPCTLMPQYCCDQLETLWLLYRQAYMPKSISHILIGGVYHPPNGDNKLMISHIMDCLDQVSKQHSNLGVILLGDFNSLPDKELRSYPLKQVVTSQTRGQSILDKIYVNISEWFLPPTILPSVTKSDHNIVLLKPTCSRPKVNGFHKFRLLNEDLRIPTVRLFWQKL